MRVRVSTAGTVRRRLFRIDPALAAFDDELDPAVVSDDEVLPDEPVAA
jgi:hypothetical protein